MTRALVITLCAASACTSPPPPCSLDLQTDSVNCGECGNVCGAGTRCEAGLCVKTCAGLRCAAASGPDVCVDPLTDPAHCGACGFECPAQHAAPLCVQGRCSHGPCEPGWFDCDAEASNGCENRDAACRINICSMDPQVSRSCQPMALSADGRRVIFGSREPDFVPGDFGFSYDLFLFEVPTRRYQRLSLALDGKVPFAEPGNAAALSGDGTRAAFTHPSRLTPDDTDSALDVYLVNLETGLISLTPGVELRDAGLTYADVSVSLSHNGQRLARAQAFGGEQAYAYVVELPRGAPAPLTAYSGVALSPDGRLLALAKNDGGFALDPYVIDLDAGTESLVLPRRYKRAEPPNASSSVPALSFDGTVKAFHSTRLGFLPDDPDGGSLGDRVFVVGADGGVRVFSGFGPSLSYDGRRIAFTERSGGVPRGCVVYDLEASQYLRIGTSPFGGEVCIALSGDGHSVLIAENFDGWLVRVP